MSETRSNPTTAGQAIGSMLLGRYRVERWIGSGLLGVVYEVTDTNASCRAAAKVLHPWVTAKLRAVPDAFERLERLKNVSHPNLARVVDIGSQDESVVLVSELVTGQVLEDWIKLGPLPLGRAVQVVLDVGSAVGAAHAIGFCHGDVKPSNIVVDQAGHARIVDFAMDTVGRLLGDSRDTAAIPMPTPTSIQFLAPEVIRDPNAADVQTDVYGLGIVLYTMLTGFAPFRSKHLPNLVLEILSVEPPVLGQLRPDIPQEISTAVTQAISKLPHGRFGDVAHFTKILEGHRFVNDPPPPVEMPVLEKNSLDDVVDRANSIRRDSEVNSAIIAAQGLGVSRPGRLGQKLLVGFFVLGLVVLIFAALR